MPIYFTAELFHFLARLKRNNNRNWFLAHKDEYEKRAARAGAAFHQ